MTTSLEELYDIFIKSRKISTDSRQILPGSLFFALKGDNFDGNTYADAAIEAGAEYAVIDNEAFAGKQTLLVKDVLQTLQQLALFHRRKFEIPVIAITGSNGKTTTKELINIVLSQQYQVTATKGNLNNHIGVPLTLLDITYETQIAIIEMGANHQGEIAELCKIAEPTYGIITNIGKAHLGGFGGYEGVIKAKSELYTWLRNSSGHIFIHAGNPLLLKLGIGINQTSYGDENGLYTQGKIKKNAAMLELDWVHDTEITAIQTSLVGSYNFENVLAAICIGTYFKVVPSQIKSAIALYQPSNSRSQSIKTAHNSIILDAYNANPTSMQAAIENFRQIKATYKMVILGDMLELGDESLAEHQAIVEMVEKSGFDKAILVGPDFMEAAENKFQCFPDSDKALEWLQEQNIQNYTILIKGSRGIKMEKTLNAL